MFVCVCLCVYVCVCRRWLLVRTCYYCEYVCPIMNCEGTDTERPGITHCWLSYIYIYIHVFVCVCVCLCARVCLSSAAAAERELRCPSPAAWHLLVKLACYKGSLTMALCMCEKDNATCCSMPAARTRQVEQCQKY